MASLKKNVASQNLTFCLISATTGAGVAGATVTVGVTKDGGAQGAGAGTVTSQGSGQYNYAPTQSETNATDVGFLFTATGVIPVNVDFHTDVVDGNGLLQVDVADWNGSAVGALPTNFSSLAIDSNGNVSITANVKKNTAKAGFMFVMTDSTTHAPKTGLTVTPTRSIDGGAFAGTTNAVSEVANGTYVINLSAADTNGDHIMLRFTSAGADDLNIEIITQP